MPRKRDPTEKVATSVRITPETKDVWRRLADQRFGGNMSAALEFALQQTARREKVELQ